MKIEFDEYDNRHFDEILKFAKEKDIEFGIAYEYGPYIGNKLRKQLEIATRTQKEKSRNIVKINLLEPHLRGRTSKKLEELIFRVKKEHNLSRWDAYKKIRYDIDELKSDFMYLYVSALFRIPIFNIVEIIEQINGLNEDDRIKTEMNFFKKAISIYHKRYGL